MNVAQNIRNIISSNKYNPQIHALLVAELGSQDAMSQAYSTFTSLLHDLSTHLNVLKDTEIKYSFKSLVSRLRKNAKNTKISRLQTVSQLEQLSRFGRVSVLSEDIQLGIMGRNLRYETVTELTTHLVSILVRIIDELKQLVTLRYQNVGFNLLEEALSERMQRILGKQSIMKVSRVIELKATSANVSNSSEIRLLLGSRVKHSLHGYRGIVVGWDQRPLHSVASWTDLKGSVLGQEQPFYKILPDEADVRNVFGDVIAVPYYYVAQEHLDAYPEEYTPHHRDIDTYFTGFDTATQCFIPRDTLRYCFGSAPSRDGFTVAHNENRVQKHIKRLAPGNTSAYPSASSSAQRIDEAAFHLFDNVLLESLATIQASLIALKGNLL